MLCDASAFRTLTGWQPKRAIWMVRLRRFSTGGGPIEVRPSRLAREGLGVHLMRRRARPQDEDRGWAATKA